MATGDIVVIGPVLPLRGGIAQYNTALFRALREAGLSEIGYSFSRQYPQWLYPGSTDREPDALDHSEPGIAYTIDSLNPLTWYRTIREIGRTRPKLVVFHWWTTFWLPCFLFMTSQLKRRHIRVALICHNLWDHDADGLKVWAAHRLLARSDAFLVHSSEAARFLQANYPEKPLTRHPIPAFESYPPARGLLEKRGRLELLFFGFIRPYKGLDLLLNAVKDLGDPSVFLTVVGEPWGEDAGEWSSMAVNENVELHLHYTSATEAAEYFARADFLVLPYRRATGSAVAALALHYNTPILATSVGGLPDVVIPNETGILVRSSDVGSLRVALESVTREQGTRLSESIGLFKKRYTWHSLAAAVADLAQTRKPWQTHKGTNGSSTTRNQLGSK